MPANNITRRRVLQTVGGAGVAGAVGTGTASGDDSGPSDGYIIGVDPGQSDLPAQAADQVFRRLDFGEIGEAVSGRFSEQALDALRSNPNVRYVERNGRMHAHDQTTPYGIDITDADVAIDDGDTGEGVSVAILDTGIDAQHETLESNLGEGWAATDAACESDCSGCRFGGGGSDIDECLEEWDDDNDHGTHVAGTAAAADNGTGVLGVAPEVTLHAVKVLDCCGSGSFDDIAAGIEWSADQGHDVQNMSLGGDSDSDVVTDALRYAADRGVVMIGSAGNSGECTDCVGFPARDERVVAVSATDENDELASFSSTGPEVELAAPGVDTLSSIPRDDYDEFSGTSMSAPHVAGAAATVIADGTEDREAVRAELKDAADDIGLSDEEQGAGRLNVAAAVDADGDDDDDDEDDDEEEDESVTVATEAATDVEETSATLNGEVTELDGVDEADVGFEYGNSGEELSSDVDAGTVSSEGTFDADIDGLDGGTEYEFRAVAEIDADSDSGEIRSFTTDDGDGTGDSDPVIEQFDVTEDSNPNWSRHTVDWEVSDEDGALDTVTSEQLDAGSVVDSVTSDVSGGNADGRHDLESRRSSVDEVRLTVVDEAGNETSETESV